MTDSELKAQQRMKHKLTHRAALLRKVADELDALAAEIERADPDPGAVRNRQAGAGSDGP